MVTWTSAKWEEGAASLDAKILTEDLVVVVRTASTDSALGKDILSWIVTKTSYFIK